MAAGTCFSPTGRLTTVFRDLELTAGACPTKPASKSKIFQQEAIVSINSLQDLYREQLHDLYDAENQLIKALPELAEASTSEELRSGIEEHLEQTKEHAQRLETIFERLGEKAKGKKCKGMEGVIKEGGELLEEDMTEDTKDAAIIAAAQKAEHYEIASYGTARNYANLVGDEEAAELLEQTLEEEKETDEKLTALAEDINVEARSEGEAKRPGDRAKAKTSSRRKSAA
jgi:ferritin-like metal-binding protein YciE